MKTLNELAAAAQTEEQFLRVQRIAARERLVGALDRMRGTLATAASPLPWIRRYPLTSAAVGLAGLFAMSAAFVRRSRRTDCASCSEAIGAGSTLANVGSSLWGVARRAIISGLMTRLLWPAVGSVSPGADGSTAEAVPPSMG